MNEDMLHSIREDCLTSLESQESLPRKLVSHRIAIIGGTGFVGTWIAETIAAINDEFDSEIRVDLIGRSADKWRQMNPHLASRSEFEVNSVDIRFPFSLHHDVTLVLFASGVADPRVHASDPLRVHETTVHGISNSLSASSRLELLQRFVNISSGLVLGGNVLNQPLKENDIGLLDFTKVHNVYAESRRAAENLASLFSNQFRIPVSTARAFTFIGPYQPLDLPWAVNNFMRDALSGNNIKLHGDGKTRRSYLYGSDVAVWLLTMLTQGQDGAVYNLGGETPISHFEVAEIVAEQTVPVPKIILKSQSNEFTRVNDFYPSVELVAESLKLTQCIQTRKAIERTMKWNATRLGMLRRLRAQ